MTGLRMFPKPQLIKVIECYRYWLRGPLAPDISFVTCRKQIGWFWLVLNNTPYSWGVAHWALVQYKDVILPVWETHCGEKTVKRSSCFYMVRPRFIPNTHFHTHWNIRWRHHMETFSALLALCEGNPSVTGGFRSQRPVTRSFGIFLISAWRYGWVNNRDADDFRCHCAHYGVTVMKN